MILVPPVGFHVERALRDLALCEPECARRVAALQLKLLGEQMPTAVLETYRYNRRQQWCFGSSRTAEQCAAAGVPPEFARPSGPWLTNAASGETSAHGWTRQNASGRWMPAAVAIDIGPVGADGRIWTADDPWDEFVAATEALAASVGLRHFRDHHGCIEDRDHLQMVEWDDVRHELVLPHSPPPLPAAA